MRNVLVVSCIAMVLGGCSVVAEKTNFISDADIKSQVGGTLGYSPADLTVVNRRTEGTNTYVVVQAKDKKEFACTVNGGNLLTMGMVNPPSCTRKT